MWLWLWLWKYSQRESVLSNNSFCYRIFWKKIRWKILNSYSTEKYEEVFTGIKWEIETINGGKKLFYEKKYARIGVNTDDDVPLNKPLKFPMLTIIIRCVVQKVEELDPLIYLDKRLYESV